MTDLLKDIETYFKQNVQLGNYKIYTDTMAAGNENAIGIFEYAGLSPLPQMSGILRSIQIVVASKSVKEAKTMANTLYKSLLFDDDGIGELTDERWALVQLRQAPFKIEGDQQGRAKYVFNVGMTTYND
jgi:hypothetical protein